MNEILGLFGMLTSIRNQISRKQKIAWVWVIFFIVSMVMMLLNSINIRSPEVGIFASMIFLYICSVACGEIFFPNEKVFLRRALGVAAFILIITLLGAFLILVVRFTETLSLVCLLIAGSAICLLSVLRKGEDNQDPLNQVVGSVKGSKKSYLLLFPFLLLVAISFYALLLGRTGEGSISVWLAIPNYFLPTFFITSLSLVILLLFTRIHAGVKLALVSTYSFLSHSLFLLVWYPGRYGDSWSYLGNARFIDNTGVFYAYEWLYSQLSIADIIKYQSQYGLVVFFRRMFTLDIYWVHTFFIPVLWSLFVPIFFYEIAELLAVKKNPKFSIFCALGASLFSGLVYWGAISAAYSLGLFLLLFSILLLLYWVNTRSRRVLLLSIFASVASLFAHPQTGVFALGFVVLGVVIQSRLPEILKLAFFVSTSAIYPGVSYLQGAVFSQEGLLNLENLLSFQLDMTTLLIVFGFVGLLFSIRGRLLRTKSAFMLFVFYVTLVVNYYVSMYVMQNAPVPQRILTITDLLLVPFVVLGLFVTLNFLKIGLSRVKMPALKNVARSRSIALFSICLLSAILVTSALYQAYPRNEITEVQPAAYEIDAIYYVDSISEGRYAVLGDTNLAGLAGAFLGIDYSYGNAKGVFGVPEWNFWTMRLYQKMINSPSLSVLEDAMIHGNVGISYFVVSVREPHYEDIVKRTSEVLEANRTFGEGKITVFRYTSPTLPIKGNGPSIKVSFDGGPLTEVSTEYEYLTKNAVKYIARLTGHSSYNVTDYPTYWTFLDLVLYDLSTGVDESSDLNTYIYKTGLNQDDVLEVIWQANDHYPHAGWKEDSFKYGWDSHPGYALSELSCKVRKNGYSLTISANFSTQGKYLWFYQSKRVNNMSTDAFPYVLVRWTSTGPIAGVIVSYTDGLEQSVIAPGSESGNLTVTIVKLEPGKEIAYLVVGVSNLPDFNVSGVQTMYVDYILICAPE